MIRIFADHCVHTAVIDALFQIGFKVIRAVDKGLEKSSDQEIFNYILKNSCLLLTFDKDFGNIIRFNIKDSHGVVIVYIEGMGRKDITQRITKFFQNIKEKELKGKLFIIEPKRIRIWHH